MGDAKTLKTLKQLVQKDLFQKDTDPKVVALFHVRQLGALPNSTVGVIAGISRYIPAARVLGFIYLG
jgi:hypothetical protein